EIGTTDRTGTTVHFKPDASIFTTTEYKYDTIASRMRELSFLNKGIRINIQDLRELNEQGEPLSDSFLSEGGLKEFVAYLDETRENLIPEPIHIESEKNGVPVEIALQYNTSY